MSNHECTDARHDAGNCHGEVMSYVSRSGMTSTSRCVFHQQAHEEVLDGIADRYGLNSSPGVTPDWFDESYAGERYDEDY